MQCHIMKQLVHFVLVNIRISQSKKFGKDQESIHSSTTPDQGYHISFALDNNHFWKSFLFLSPNNTNFPYFEIKPLVPTTSNLQNFTFVIHG